MDLIQCKFSRPSQFGAKGRKIVDPVQVHNFECFGRALDGDFPASRKIECFEAVGAHVDGVIGAEIFDLNAMVGRKNNRTVRDGVRADRRDDNGIERGADDGAARCKGIGSRSIGCGDNETVSHKSVDGFVVEG